MNKNLVLPVILSFFLSCRCSEKTGVSQATPSSASVVKQLQPVTMMVVDNRDLDGCGFLLMSADSNFYNPVNLPLEFQKDRLMVNVRYNVDKKRVSICMKGELITIIEIIPAEK